MERPFSERPQKWRNAAEGRGAGAGGAERKAAWAKSRQGPCSQMGGALRMKAHIWAGPGCRPLGDSLRLGPHPQNRACTPARPEETSEILSQVPSWDWPCWCQNKGAIPRLLGPCKGAWHVVLLKENLTVISLEAAGPGTHVLHVDVGLYACLHELDSIVQGQLGGRETHM